MNHNIEETIKAALRGGRHFTEGLRVRNQDTGRIERSDLKPSTRLRSIIS